MKNAASNIAQQASYEELLAVNNLLKEERDLFKEENKKLKEENANIWHQILQLKRHVFGKRSEQLDDQRQEPLFGQEELPEQEEPIKEIQVPAHTRHSRKRKPLPADLPRVRIEHEPENCDCSSCGKPMARIGEEITEQLETVPAKFSITEHVKVKRACQHCKSEVAIGKLPAGAQIIKGSKAGASLIAQIIVSKYCDKSPLNRQEEIFARQGIDISRKRMCDWIGIVTERHLMPIWSAHKLELLKSNYVWADETTLKVQIETGEGETKLKEGYLWGMLSPGGDLYFEYDQSRSGKVALRLFEGYKGFIQTDLYAGYNKVYVPKTVTRVGCLAHVRRKFIEAQDSATKDCGEVLKLISQLYKVEKDAKAKLRQEESQAKRKFEPSEFFAIRQKLREKESLKIIAKLKVMLENLALSVLPKTPLRKAVSYALKQWDALCLPFSNGMLELDNNAIERQMRPIAVGRHNWLFAGSERGAAWAACLFSLIGTCKINGINPFEYLHDVLRLSQIPEIEPLELTPRNWQSRKNELLARMG